MIEPVTLAELFDAFRSAVPLLLTDAVSEKLAPFASVPGAETTREKVSVLPWPTVAAVAVLLDAGMEKLSGPDICVNDTRTDPVGKRLLRVTPWASVAESLLATVM